MNNTNQCSCSCNACDNGSDSTDNSYKNTLTIKWHRLVSGGGTCPRCGSTEEELEKAASTLKEALGGLNIKVILIKYELTLEEFKKNPGSSNRISFNDRLLEDLIGAKTGHSRCCDVCGGEECRTVEMGGKSHETIPAGLIIKAGLIAVSKML
jgi:hypothetical protein